MNNTTKQKFLNQLCKQQNMQEIGGNEIIVHLRRFFILGHVDNNYIPKYSSGSYSASLHTTKSKSYYCGGSYSNISKSGKSYSSSSSKPTSSGSGKASSKYKSGSKSKNKSSDPYDAKSYAHPDDFYYDYYDDFWDYEDAEEYLDEHQDD